MLMSIAKDAKVTLQLPNMLKNNIMKLQYFNTVGQYTYVLKKNKSMPILY